MGLLCGSRYRHDDRQPPLGIEKPADLGEIREPDVVGVLNQLVGDSGWQLSLGERSHLFVARELLQRAELVILDESFGAPDPGNLRRAVECAQRRSSTLIVIAHP